MTLPRHIILDAAARHYRSIAADLRYSKLTRNSALTLAHAVERELEEELQPGANDNATPSSAAPLEGRCG